jgi:moderate conductance mechanosensitive channel
MLSGDRVGGWMGLLAHQIEGFFRELLVILSNFPMIFSAFRQAFSTILVPPPAGRSLTATALLLSLSIVLVLLPQPFLRRHPYRPAWRLPEAFMILAVAVLNDAMSLTATVLIAGCAAAFFFTDTAPLDQLSVGILWAATRWRIAMLGIDIFLRPGRPQFRLIPIDEANARAVTRRMALIFALALAFVCVVPVLLMHDLQLQPARALAITLAAVEFPLCLSAVVHLANGVQRAKTRIWLFGAGTALLFWLTWIGSVLALDFTFYDALTELLAIAWIITLIYQIGRLAMPAYDARQNAVSETTILSDVLITNCVRRCLLVIAIAVGFLFNAKRWAVDVSAMVDAERWPVLAGSLGLTAFTAVAGYLGYEALRTWSSIRFGPQAGSLGFGADDGEDAAHVGSRLATILPILSRILLLTFLALAAVLGLSNSGINIAPILAGAGIFGLAISFGSQALVRDIVSGFFFIVDDAFRVGEYIDTGRLKGTVERISLRSFRLRHQNGQVHTVPYGQLGAVTNFSRDWSTIKFNLRLARDSDLERIRKIAKRTGLEMLNDPETGAEFLAPLKLQGIADILESALVLRFKFTVRPIKASTVQRDAIKRLYAAFRTNQIEFATNSVVVSTDSNVAPNEMAAAGHEVVSLASGGTPPASAGR